MNKSVLGSALIAATVAAPVFAQSAPASPWSFNLGVTSDYLFRGISQTHGRPALQGGVDYLHSSGLYIGGWASTISWVKDFTGGGSTEIDVYGGMKNSFAGGDWNYDVGYITYNYPGRGRVIPTVLANPNTQELYGSIGYKWISVKYSQATSKNFIGWYGGTGYNLNTRGSGYLEVNANYDLGDGWTLIGHVGQQSIKNYVDVPTLRTASYTDYKLGVSKDVGFGTVTAAYSTTDVKGTCGPNAATNTSSYCWGNTGVVPGISGPTGGFTNVAKSKLVLSFLKTF